MRAASAIRLAIAEFLALLLVLMLFGTSTAAPQPSGVIAAAAVDANLRASIAEYFASLWRGTPALWTPPAPPANTELRFYDISGGSQNELEDAMARANICNGHCLQDPGQPKQDVAWALEGEISPGRFYCYSPRTLYLTFRHYILLPRWTPAPDGSVLVNTVVAWNALLPVMFTHESRHAQIAEADLAALNAQAEAMPSCAAAIAFWEDPHVFDKLNADQSAYHAQLRADCRPEIGCPPYGYFGWG